MVEVAVCLVGCGCADKNFVKGALQVGPSRNNEILLQVATGVKTEQLVDTVPLSQEGALKCLYASAKVEIQMKFTNCKFKFEI